MTILDLDTKLTIFIPSFLSRFSLSFPHLPAHLFPDSQLISSQRTFLVVPNCRHLERGLHLRLENSPPPLKRVSNAKPLQVGKIIPHRHQMITPSSCAAITAPQHRRVPP
ncbi:unnamed protein product [Cuscuta europaea]|uniref:Uncharacterized protein n=1 Tax=Cuscuta europaea TaxID=41803 RepID=A0A9P1E1X0_CUSEU|nr:unnamed protein product [Cuscuta europaea]